MARTIVSFVIGLVLAFSGVAFFGWLLWWLWTRLSREQEVAPIEIEAEMPAAETPAAETPAAETPAVETPAMVADRAVEIEIELEPEIEAPEPPVAPDDLKRIEGIGPKISGVLQEAGIMTFAQLAAATPDRIAGILEAADPRLLRLADPASWPEQAALAATGEWEALEALQGRLKGGRRV